MEPDVRYCTTADGLRIAYTVTGEGPPHVMMNDPVSSHVRRLWAHPLSARLMGEWTRYNTAISYDPHGSGMSDRTVVPSLDSFVHDLEAVVDTLQLEEFALSAVQGHTPAAIAYVVRHPERVRRLALIDGYARISDLMDTPPGRALAAAAAMDWETATEAIGALVFGPGHEEARAWGAHIRACVDPGYFTNPEHFRDVDASNLLTHVSVPTLVVHHTGVRYVTDEMTRELVTRIPDARLITIDGLWADRPEALARRVAEFLNEGLTQTTQSSSRTTSGVRTVLFTDLVGHTEMMRRLGDARGRELLRDHERITRDAIKQHGGTEIKTDGDSFMVSFGSVAAAMECAIGLQRAFAARNEDAPEPLRVRMGLNAGEPVEDEGDLFGETVILAARIKDQADEGEILIAEPVRHLLAGKGFVFADRGEFLPKGFEDAVRLFEVRWRGE